MPFRDRRDAGRRLAARLEDLRAELPLVFGLPRGGVVVAFEVARALGASLDVLVVRKLGAPRQPELAIGAIGEGGVRHVNEGLARALRIAPEDLEAIVRRESEELGRRLRLYRGDRPPQPVDGKTAIVVDDGLATGATATVAARVLRRRGAGRVILAVPVGAPQACEALRAEADEVVCLETPAALLAIGEWYEDFSQTSDEEVVALLAEAAAGAAGPR